ncbi:MAG: molybdate ABC transporter substrate-binding protein [Proteobacteria bacterium]|nr:molybdate ABC transporter substrate-binding protein [Pseudomonadota bacterium]
MPRKVITLFASLVLVVALCSPDTRVRAETQQEITVSVAISLRNAFQELSALFQKKHPDIKVSCNFGASGDLAKQIAGGAPVDLFCSAAQKDMDELEKAGCLLKETRVNCVKNSLVLIVPAASDLRLRTVADLKNPAVKKIAIGNPKTVPAGRYAHEVFSRAGILEAIQDRLIFAENVRQVLDYTVRGEVDAGMVYKTDALLQPQGVRIIQEAPEASHAPIIYPMAVVRATKNATAARRFLDFTLSQEARSVFEKLGFKPVP